MSDPIPPLETRPRRHAGPVEQASIPEVLERIRSGHCVTCAAPLGVGDGPAGSSAYCARHQKDQRRARLAAMTPAQLLAELEAKARLSGREALAMIEARRRPLSGREALQLLEDRTRLQNQHRLRMLELKQLAAL